MPTATLTGPLTDTAGTPLAHRQVVVRPGVLPTDTGTVGVVAAVTARTDDSGQVSIPVACTTTVMPFYTVACAGLTWSVSVPSPGSFRVTDPAIRATTAAPPETWPTGSRVPTGGDTGQVLTKTSGADYDTGWVDPTGGASDGPTGLWPQVQIDTGGVLIQKDTSTPCTITVTQHSTPGTALVAGGTIKGHGNSTWGLPKNPYNLKFDTKQPFLGMDAAKGWTLLANWYDRSNVSIPLAFAAAAQWLPGLAFTPAFRFCEVILNGLYVGLYVAVDKVELGPTRINQPAPSADTGDALTGCYALEADNKEALDDPLIGFTTADGQYFQYDDPDGTDLTEAQRTYITGWMATLSGALFHPTSLTDPASSWRQYVDADAMADWYILEELASNLDSDWWSSCKLHKTPDSDGVPGQLVMGPLWDFDNAWGTATWGDPVLGLATGHSPQGFFTRRSQWMAAMFRDATFWELVSQRWVAFRSAAIDSGALYELIEDLILPTGDASVRDQRAFGYTTFLPQWVAQRKTWISERVAWLDPQLTAPASPVPDSVTTTV